MTLGIQAQPAGKWLSQPLGPACLAPEPLLATPRALRPPGCGQIRFLLSSIHQPTAQTPTPKLCLKMTFT